MAVIVAKVEGAEVPDHHAESEGEQVFRVTDEDGTAHYINGEENAAKLAVDLSEKAKDKAR